MPFADAAKEAADSLLAVDETTVHKSERIRATPDSHVTNLPVSE